MLGFSVCVCGGGKVGGEYASGGSSDSLGLVCVCGGGKCV